MCMPNNVNEEIQKFINEVKKILGDRLKKVILYGSYARGDYNKKSDVFVVSVDTGLSHLTAALDRPNITVYGPTDPGLIGGYGKNQVVCRAPLMNLNNLEAAAVYKKITLI